MNTSISAPDVRHSLDCITEKLIKTIRNWVEVPDNSMEAFLQRVHPISLQAGEYFIKEGQVPRKFGFVTTGLFRYLYVDSQGREFTKAFFPENTFISSYTAMVGQLPSFLTIQALADSTLLELQYPQWLELRRSDACWDRLLICLLEKGYATKEKREREFLLLDAASRYKNFMEEFPQLASGVKQHMIASYLGITPIALSRIRRKMGLINIG